MLLGVLMPRYGMQIMAAVFFSLSSYHRRARLARCGVRPSFAGHRETEVALLHAGHMHHRLYSRPTNRWLTERGNSFTSRQHAR